VDTRQYIKNRVKYPKNKKRFNTKRDAPNTENTVESSKDKGDKPRFPRRRTYKKPKAEEESNPSNAEIQVSIFHVSSFTISNIFSYLYQ